MYDLIFSINIFEKLDFLKEQIKNIIYFTKNLNVLIIFNCNDFMYELTKNLKIEGIDIIVNPEIINKRRWHGSLTKGIFSNLTYIFKQKIEFKYFIVFSSRNILIKKINLENIKDFFNFTNKKLKEIELSKKKFIQNRSLKNFKILDNEDLNNKDFNHVINSIRGNKKYWFYNRNVVNDKLWFKKFYNQSKFMIGGKHEQLCFPFKVCQKMNRYINLNKNIMKEIYNTCIAVEEIIPQTLSIICSCDNLSFTFISLNFAVKTWNQKSKSKRSIEILNEIYKILKLIFYKLVIFPYIS